MWDLGALRSPLMRAKKHRNQAVPEMRGFLSVYAKTTGLLFFVGLSYMMFRCAHVEWEISKDKFKMMSLPDYMAHCFFLPTLLVRPISPYSYFVN